MLAKLNHKVAENQSVNCFTGCEEKALIERIKDMPNSATHTKADLHPDP
jgi:uncharacterized coiled-coil protein SlyX